MNDNYKYIKAEEALIIEARNKKLVSDNEELIDELEKNGIKLRSTQRTSNGLIGDVIELEGDIMDLEDEKDKLEDNRMYDCEYLRNWIDDLLKENEMLKRSRLLPPSYFEPK